MDGAFRGSSQSGQPYRIDYSGAVGSVLLRTQMEPIVPLAPGCTAKNAVTGAIGNNFNFPALKSSLHRAFAPPMQLAQRANRRIVPAPPHPAGGPETNFWPEAAKYLSPVLAETRRHFHRQRHANFGALYAEVQLRRF